MRAGWFVCLYFCQYFCHSGCAQDYFNNNRPISLKLGVMKGSTSRKNRLTFGGNPVPDTDSASLSTSLTTAAASVCVNMCPSLSVNSPTGQTPQQIFTVDSLKDADLHKDVPFGGLDDE